MATQFKGENRPEASHGAEGEVVTRGDSVSPLVSFAERLGEKLKYEGIIKEVNEDKNLIKILLKNNVLVIIDPQLEKDGSLIYTDISIRWYDFEDNYLQTLTLSSKEIIFEDGEKTLSCKYREVYEDPVMLVNEEELIDYLNELSIIGDLDEFIQFAEEEFKRYTGL